MCKPRCVAMAFVVATFFAAVEVEAQTPSASPSVTPSSAADCKSTPSRVIGEVTALDPGTKRITLKATDGQSVNFGVDAQTIYRRIPLGETTLDRAVAITFGEIGIGDRLRILYTPGTNPLIARTVLVVSKTELAQKQERDRAEWLKRGIVRRVTALNADTKEISLLARTLEGVAPVVGACHLITRVSIEDSVSSSAGSVLRKQNPEYVGRNIQGCHTGF